MKKILLPLFMAAIIAFLSFSTTATEYSDPRDSRNISQDVLEQLDDAGTELIIKAYNMNLLLDFRDYDNIEDILAYRNVREWIVYIKKGALGLSSHSYYEGSGSKLGTSSAKFVNWCRKEVQEYQTMEAILSVAPDITVNCVYFLYGASRQLPSAIYYKTNYGDYVFTHDWYSGRELLFASERFFEYQRALAAVESILKGGFYLAGGGSDGDWDLSAYDYRSENFDPHAPFPKGAEPEQTPSSYLWVGIAAGAVVLTAIAAFFALKIKRKAAILPEEA